MREIEHMDMALQQPEPPGSSKLPDSRELRRQDQLR